MLELLGVYTPLKVQIKSFIFYPRKISFAYYISYRHQMGVSILWLKGLLMCYGPVIITMIIILVLYTQMDSRRVLPRRKHDGKSSTYEYIEKYERWKKTK